MPTLLVNKTPKSDPTVMYQKRSATINPPPGSSPFMQHCKRCASLMQPVSCGIVSGHIYRRGTCLQWTLAPSTGP